MFSRRSTRQHDGAALPQPKLCSLLPPHMRNISINTQSRRWTLVIRLHSSLAPNFRALLTEGRKILIFFGSN
jgi:hypothetical protein